MWNLEKSESCRLIIRRRLRSRGGGHLGKIGYGDVPLGRVPFLDSKHFWQGHKFTNFRNLFLTGSIFGYFSQFSGWKLEDFSIFGLRLVIFATSQGENWKISQFFVLVLPFLPLFRVKIGKIFNFSIWQGPILPLIHFWQGPIFKLQRHVGGPTA